ncbi:hypothetical protein F5X99DRAFT_427059 [Biscogniauxia marginata]|nr:hypothetical protein F5X99DRAFT_427059 [Biscogniauxia marginata]
MASLKFIMDVDDEERDPGVIKTSKEPNPPVPSSIKDPSRQPTSSHENPQHLDDRLTPAHTKRRGPSGRSTKPTTTASSSSTATSSARPPPARRRSTDSIESTMEPTGYGGPGQSSSSTSMTPSGRTNAPSRPVPNVPGDGNFPIKLTPITGRVSRAKKGVPVHTCETCRPPKTFTRAEHLRRHQLSHKTPGFRCDFPDCDKAFHRADLLARHAQRHEQYDKSSKGTGGSTSSQPPEVSLGEGPFMPHPSMGGSSTMGAQSDMSGSAYPGNTPSYQPMSSNPGSSGGQTPMAPHHHPGRRGSYSPSPAGIEYVLSSQQHFNQPGIGGSPITGTPYGGLEYQQQPRTSSPFPVYIGPQGLSHHLPSLTIPDNNVPGLLPPTDTSPWPSSASDSNFSTPSDGHRRLPANDWSIYQSGAPQSIHSPELDTMTSAAPFFVNNFSPSHQYSPYEPMLDLPTSFPDERTLLDPTHPHPYSSVRSPTPPPVSLSAQSAENLVTLAAPSIPDGPSILGRQKESAATLGPYSGAAFLTAITLSRPILNAIPEYLDAYWKRFDTLFPLVHHRSFEPIAVEVLRCAMAAVGTQFLQGKEDRIRGNTLHEFAWQEARRFPQWNVQVMQAILLCEFYARFRGRKAVYRPSQSFQSLYSRVANSQSPDNYASSAATREERWHEWIGAETRRRLLAACFVLDAHTSMYHEQPFIHTFSVPTPPIPLTRRSDDLWNAQTLEAWESLITSTSTTNLEPATLSEEINLTPERIATAPPLDRAIFLASETLRLPRRPNASTLDLTAELNLASIERISRLFPGSAVANTYLALHYTPLHDLLAVSGDSWLFSQKELDSQKFQQRQQRLKLWSGSPHAGAATGFAAKALLAFLDHNNNNDNNNTPNTAAQPKEENRETEMRTRARRDSSSSSSSKDRDRRSTTRTRNTSDISDYWALYVCALICWALSHRATRGAAAAARGGGPSTTSRSAVAAGAERAEREATAWLRTVAGLSPEEVLNVRGRGREAAGVVSMARRRLEDEAAGGRSRLLVDALGVLRKLEDGVNWRGF